MPRIFSIFQAQPASVFRAFLLIEGVVAQVIKPSDDLNDPGGFKSPQREELRANVPDLRQPLFGLPVVGAAVPRDLP